MELDQAAPVTPQPRRPRPAGATGSPPDPGAAESLHRESVRQAALAAYGVLDEAHASRTDLRALVALAAAACGMPMATLNLLTEDEQLQLECVGFTGGPSPRSDSMCAVVVDEPEPTVLADASEDARFRDNPWVTGPAHVRFYASFPLRTPDDVAIGSLCVFDPEPRALDEEQRDTLRTLAARVVDVLELELKARRLREELADLEATHRRLTRANQRLATFASTVSHDLRNPLTALEFALTFAGDALDEAADPPPRAQEMVRRALRGARRMGETVERLLAEADGAATGAVAVSLDRVLDEVLEDLGPAVAGVDLAVDAPLPWVLGDAAGLRLVLQNLLANAAKYAVPQDPRVALTARRAGEVWEVRVVDHGPGIAPADRDRVLAHRERGEGAAVAAGSGIGLATCREILRQVGGSVTVEGTPGGGATLLLRLPALT